MLGPLVEAHLAQAAAWASVLVGTLTVASAFQLRRYMLKDLTTVGLAVSLRRLTQVSPSAHRFMCELTGVSDRQLVLDYWLALTLARYDEQQFRTNSYANQTAAWLLSMCQYEHPPNDNDWQETNFVEGLFEPCPRQDYELNERTTNEKS